MRPGAQLSTSANSAEPEGVCPESGCAAGAEASTQRRLARKVSKRKVFPSAAGGLVPSGGNSAISDVPPASEPPQCRGQCESAQ